MTPVFKFVHCLRRFSLFFFFLVVVTTSVRLLLYSGEVCSFEMRSRMQARHKQKREGEGKIREEKQAEKQRREREAEKEEGNKKQNTPMLMMFRFLLFPVLDVAMRTHGLIWLQHWMNWFVKHVRSERSRRNTSLTG
jgi:Flp pilus assembly protein TadB